MNQQQNVVAAFQSSVNHKMKDTLFRVLKFESDADMSEKDSFYSGIKSKVNLMGQIKLNISQRSHYARKVKDDSGRDEINGSG